MSFPRRLTRTHALFAGAAFLAVVGVVAVVALVRGWRPSASRPFPASPAAWCPAGFEPIAGDGCLAASGRAAGAHELVVYLHGMYAPGPGERDENERRAKVARIANAHGFAVLALRGRQGQCSAEDKRAHFCWPSNERNAGDGPAFAEAMTFAIGAAEARLGKMKRQYLLGFSNGGYFAALVSTRALVAFNAVVIAGAGPVDPVRADGAKPPIFLLTADEDASVESMMRLDAALDRAGWAHAIASRDGGHALTDADITLAVTFFERTRKETLPLKPPVSTRKPRPKLAGSASGDAGPFPPPPAAPAEAAPTAAPEAAVTAQPAEATP